MVTRCRSGGGTVWLSTAMAPLTVARGGHPGCSVVVVVVGGIVVVVVGTVVGAVLLTAASLPVAVREQPTSTMPARSERRVTRHPGDVVPGSFRWPTSGEHRGPTATDGVTTRPRSTGIGNP